MNPWRVAITTEQSHELSMEIERHPWILGNPRTTMTKIRNLIVSIVMYIDTWQRIVKSQKKKRR